MQCVICKNGETKPGKATVTLEREAMTLVFKSVPASVCENCGEEYIDEKITSALLTAAEESAKSGVQVDIREFATA